MIMKSKYYIVLALFFAWSAMVVAQNSDERMKQLVEERKQNNLTTDDHTIFKIQIYSGLSEAKAKSTRSSFEASFPGYGSDLSYNPPEWKVQVGRFSSEIEAYKALEHIRQKYPGAFRLKVQ